MAPYGSIQRRGRWLRRGGDRSPRTASRCNDTLRGVTALRRVVTEPSEDEGPEAQAKELQARLVVLRLREGTANFEDKEAIRREIRRIEEELESLGVDPDLEDGPEETGV
jgi:hypothetical protein